MYNADLFHSVICDNKTKDQSPKLLLLLIQRAQ